jgi:uncharacterized surface protein with fasciclin (FAS1) repeats/predicted lipoprotein with Yx(FWY)xxD motif
MKHLSKLFYSFNAKMVVLLSMIVLIAGTVRSQTTVVDIIAGSAEHTILAGAVTDAGLIDALSGEGPFTVFAPTDDAFNALPAGLLESLSVQELTSILFYHVVADKALSADLSDGQKVITLRGQEITVTISNGDVFINDAEVTFADIDADNGVVHVIDAVLIPDLDVKIADNDAYGSILTDYNGNTLYFFANDADGTSACTEGCLNNWPVFYSAFLNLPEGLDPDDFGSIDRGDGVMQTTYKGWPLYYFVNDNDSGDVNGEGIINKWFVAKPDYTIMLVDNQLVGLDGVSYTGDYTPGDEIVQYLVDAYGNTLYTWVNDRNNRNRFTNEDFSNNTNWPIYEQDEIMIPSTLDADDFEVIDVFGTPQLTFKGWPLYFFGQDNERGETKGVSVPQPGIWPVAVPGMMEAPPYTVIDIAVSSSVHTTLVAAVTAAGLVETLQGEGPFTVFAPTDDAFDALPEGLLADLLADPQGELTRILLYHVAGGKVFSDDLEDGMTITTVQGQRAKITINEDGVFINDAQVILADLEADNGVVHVIDAVIVPGPATVVDIIVGSEVHSTLAAAVTAAGLVETLQGEGPFTVFAPTDNAFDALPEGLLDDLLADPQGELTRILLYHVAGGKAFSSDLEDEMEITTVLGQNAKVTISKDGVFINDAEVIIADLEADNGVVHVIDAVLVPIPATVVDIIVGSEVHTTLAAAVTAAGLVETLQGEGPFTVFAPTNDAFDALPEGLLEDLLADAEGLLTKILLYHVASGKVFSGDLEDGMTITTVQGQRATITINEEGVFINDAQVLIADLEAENGVVHVIDAVIVPGPATVVDIIVGSEVHTTLAAAVTAAGLVETLQGEGPFTVFAPTDDAFDALPEGMLAELLEEPEGLLTKILLYHVAGGKVFSTDLEDGMTITTAQGQRAKITINEEGVFINDAQVILADLEADNGVVHVIDAVIVPGPATVVDIIVGSEVHTTLAAAVTAAGLVETLQGEGPFTVFAPTDDAFDALPEGMLAELLEEPEGLLTKILLYHVAGGKVFSTDLEDGMTITTAQGQRAKIMINEEGVFINDAQVILADLEADNGVVHVIDAVIVPGPATVVDIIVGSEVHTTLAAAVTAAGLVETLQGEGPFTVFAPTDDAFDALPEGMLAELLEEPEGLLTKILLYHVAGGKVFSTDLEDGMTITTAQGQRAKITINEEGVFINDAQVILADLEADNGVVHVIDAVIVPGPATVVDIIVGSEVHTTLAAAVTAAGLVETLQGEGPFTVFAPTDDAFDALPEGMLAELLEEPEGLLTKILLYHVAGGKVFSTDLEDGMTITTAQGQRAKISINEDGVFINDAQVILADLEADNGVVHVIDAVIVPGPATVVDIIVGSEVHETLAAAVTAAGLVETLQGEGPFSVFAPTDDAFDALPEGLLDDLLADPQGELTRILLYHVAAGKVFSDDLADEMEITTVLGQNVKVTINEDGVFINDAEVIIVDLEADNGVVHVIDAVLVPKPATVVDIINASEAHTNLALVLAITELDEVLKGEGPFTVFAPTDAAFEALPAGLIEGLTEEQVVQILLYHVVAAKALSTDLSDGQEITTVLGQDVTVSIVNGDVFINNAQVIVADLEAENGVVHVIDAILLPEFPEPTVVEIIAASDIHTTLAGAVVSAGLVDALSGEGPFTVFAPTDAAFEALPAGLLEGLSVAELTNVLLYHVVADKALSTDLSNEQTLTTMLGEDVTVTIVGEDVFINNAKVIVADLEASNGVVHVIDAVLLVSTNVSDLTSGDVSLNLYPNPARDFITIETTFNGNSDVVVELFNIVGKRVMSLDLGSHSEMFNERIDVSNLPQGTYILNIRTNGSVQTRKVNLMR